MMMTLRPSVPKCPSCPVADVDEGAGVVRVRLTGEIDLHNAPMIRARLGQYTGVDLLIDARSLEFVDSSGLGMLAGLAHNLEATGHHLLITGLARSLRRIFEISGLGALVE